MMKKEKPIKVGIYIPSELASRLKEVAEIKNFSKFCQECIKNELDGASSKRLEEFVIILRTEFEKRIREMPDLFDEILNRSIAEAWNKIVFKEYKNGKNL